MTCKDCIHYGVCMDFTTLKESEFAQNFNQAEMSCDYFKNKADFVEVVRCKDCKRAKPLIFEGFYKCYRQNACRKAYDFCSYGERKDT